MRTIGLLCLAVMGGLSLACSETTGGSSGAGIQVRPNQPTEIRHIFECAPPALLNGAVTGIHFEGERASEETEPYVGAFFTSAIAFDKLDGGVALVALDEPLNFSSTSAENHDACSELKFHKVGPFVFFEHIGAGGNPYPPQQLVFMDVTGSGFRPASELHPLMGQDFTEFEKNGCLTALRHGDGLVNRICYVDSKFVLRHALLENQYQKDRWHVFLCDFSEGVTKVLESRVKSTSTVEAVDVDPDGSREKMLEACRQFLTEFNEKVTPRI